MGPFSEIGSLKRQSSSNEVIRWALTQHDLCPSTKGRSGHKDVPSEGRPREDPGRRAPSTSQRETDPRGSGSEGTDRAHALTSDSPPSEPPDGHVCCLSQWARGTLLGWPQQTHKLAPPAKGGSLRHCHTSAAGWESGRTECSGPQRRDRDNLSYRERGVSHTRFCK